MKFNAAFWKWFGKSKVVDAKGRPLVVYHGTAKSFTKFDTSKTGLNWKSDRRGLFFTTSPKESEHSARKSASRLRSGKSGALTIPAYISLQNPIISNARYGQNAVNEFDASKEEYLEALARGGFDGIVISDNKDKLVVALHPTQIKSAIGNDGSWDADDPDIRSNPQRIADDIIIAAERARELTEDNCVKIAGQCFEASERLYDELTKLGYDPAVVAGYFIWGGGGGTERKAITLGLR